MQRETHATISLVRRRNGRIFEIQKMFIYNNKVSSIQLPKVDLANKSEEDLLKKGLKRD